MKVLVTSDSYLPRIGGAEIYALKLGVFLEKLGHKVRLFTPEPSCGEQETSPFPVIRENYLRKPVVIFNFYRTLLREFKKADIVHCVYAHKVAAMAGLLKFLFKKPIVVTLQGRGILDLPGNTWFFAKLHTLYRVLALKRADVVIASCLEFVDIAKRYVSEEKIIYIPNSLDVGEFIPRLKKWDLLPFDVNNRLVVATIRRFVPKNGIQFLVEAIPSIVERKKDVLFLFIGWGRLEEYLKARVRELKIERYVYFAGRVENNKLPDYLNLSDIVIFPSTAESTSIACLESMALGKPIIASKVGGYPEMVEDNVNGYLVNLTDKLESDYRASMTLPPDKLQALADKVVDLMLDREKRERFGNRSRNFAEEKFSWDGNVKKIEQVYSIAKNKTKGALEGLKRQQ
jgi:glycosyltransferase involved in cell wall biosynthesis